MEGDGGEDKPGRGREAGGGIIRFTSLGSHGGTAQLARWLIPCTVRISTVAERNVICSPDANQRISHLISNTTTLFLSLPI